ncbi:hypothetical protein H3291_27145, partial [Escherichia coli]|nr:hypothetical protein [Escherichia coli]
NQKKGRNKRRAGKSEDVKPKSERKEDEWHTKPKKKKKKKPFYQGVAKERPKKKKRR